MNSLGASRAFSKISLDPFRHAIETSGALNGAEHGQQALRNFIGIKFGLLLNATGLEKFSFF